VAEKPRQVRDRVDHVVRRAARSGKLLFTELAGAHQHAGDADRLRGEDVVVDVVADHRHPAGG